MNTGQKYAALLQKFDPDAESLFALISKPLDNKTIRQIAGADYTGDVDRHFIALRDIRDTQNIPDPLDWHPREALELYRWHEFSKKLPPDIKRQAHTNRTFACVILLQATRSGIGENQTIAVLLESLASLDMSFQKEAVRFFAWCVQNLRYENESPFYPLALLILVLRTRFKLKPTELRDLVNCVYDEVRTVREYPWRTPNPQWLTWLTIFNQRHEIWQELGQEIAIHAERFPNSAGRQNLKALARHLEIIPTTPARR